MVALCADHQYARCAVLCCNADVCVVDLYFVGCESQAVMILECDIEWLVGATSGGLSAWEESSAVRSSRGASLFVCTAIVLPTVTSSFPGCCSCLSISCVSLILTRHSRLSFLSCELLSLLHIHTFTFPSFQEAIFPLWKKSFLLPSQCPASSVMRRIIVATCTYSQGPLTP